MVKLSPVWADSQALELQAPELLSAIARCQPPTVAAPAWHRLPRPVLEAAQRLVQLLFTLRAPDSGWPAQQPYTAEALTPYVAEEACDLLTALQQLASQSQGAIAAVPADLLDWVDWQLCQFSVADLQRQLLWELSSSGHLIMQLLTGLGVTVADGGLAQTGMLRLVARLETEQDGSDLNPVDGGRLLDDGEWLRLDSDACQRPLTVAQLRRAIACGVQQHRPVLQAFLQGQPVRLLVPGQLWQSAQLRLSLRLVLTQRPLLPPSSSAADLAQTESRPQPAPEIKDEELTLDDLALALTGALSSPQADQLALAASVSASRNGSHRVKTQRADAVLTDIEADSGAIAASALPQAWVIFTDEQWIGNLSALIARQHLVAKLPKIQANHLPQPTDPPQLDLDKHLPAVIQAACEAVEVVASPGLFQQNFFQHAIFLADWQHQLLWYVRRAAAVVAQLVEGIPGQLLAPGSPWQTGQLRLLTTLQLSTAQRKLMIDLATAQPLAYPVQRLHRDGIIQSDQLLLTRQPQTVAQLETRLYRLLRHTTPEIDWLLRGTTVELHLLDSPHLGDPEQQVGTAQIGLGLQFVTR